MSSTELSLIEGSTPVQLAVQPVVPSLASLKPVPGDPVRLEVRHPKARFNLRFVGLFEGKGVILSAPRQQKIKITEGSALLIKMICANRICSFSSRLVKIQEQPYPLWHIEYPLEMTLKRLRQHTRVPVALKVMIDAGDDAPNSQWPALCTDISLQGASVEVISSSLPLKNKMFITARIRVAGVDHVLLLPASICRVVESEQVGIKITRYSLEFSDLDEDTHLTLAGFVYQQWLYECGQLDTL